MTGEAQQTPKPTDEEVRAAAAAGYQLLRRVAEMQPEAQQVLDVLSRYTSEISPEDRLDPQARDVTDLETLAFRVSNLLYNTFGQGR